MEQRFNLHAIFLKFIVIFRRLDDMSSVQAAVLNAGLQFVIESCKLSLKKNKK